MGNLMVDVKFEVDLGTLGLEPYLRKAGMASSISSVYQR
jgi:hypothetical protein